MLIAGRAQLAARKNKNYTNIARRRVGAHEKTQKPSQDR
jgi:hypothetical protein